MVDVAVGLVIKKDRVLISKRDARKTQGNLWEFPGGKLEHQESPLQALCRELKEEVAIDVTEAAFLFSQGHQYESGYVQLHFFEVLAYQGRPQHLEGQVLLWQPIVRIREKLFPKANQKAVDWLSETYNSVSK